MAENSLYKMSAEIMAINNQIVTEDGEITPELEAMLDALTLQVEDKAVRIAKWTLDIAGKADTIQSEIDRLQKRKKVTENLRTRLKDYIKNCMDMAGIKKVEGDVLTLALQKNPPSCAVDENRVPDKYKTVITQTVVDKAAILRDLKAGQQIDGAELKPESYHLRIR